MRPTKYLLWSARDRTLAETLLEYESSLNQVGLPSWIARDEDRRFVVDELMDHSLATYEQAVEEYERGKSDTKGLQLVVLDEGPRTQPSGGATG